MLILSDTFVKKFLLVSLFRIPVKPRIAKKKTDSSQAPPRNKKEKEQYYKLTEDNEIKKETRWDFILEQLGKSRKLRTNSRFSKLNEQVKD